MSLLDNYFKNRQNIVSGHATKLLILGIDLMFAAIAFYLALMITLNFNVDRASEINIWRILLVLLIVRGLLLVIFKTYLIIIRYVGEKDQRNVFYAITSSSVIFYVLLLVIPDMFPAPLILSIILIDYLLALGSMIGFRILLRIIFDQLRLRQGNRLNTVIFGAGELGATLERVLKQNPAHHYQVVAFFDDNPKVHRKFLNGIRIFNPRRSFVSVIRRHNVRVVIIAVRSLSEERRIEFLDHCLEYKIKVLKLPSIDLWLGDNLNVGQLRDIRFEDLLNRPPIQLNEEGIRASVTGKVVLVTGCAGSIGSEIVRQLLRFSPQQIIGFDQAETPLVEIGLSLERALEAGQFKTVIGSVQDAAKLEMIFRTYRPAYVFHAAAYKHVPIMEAHPEEAIKVNVLGTRNVADLASKYGVHKFVMVSTDKAVNPSNVMGASKRIAEIYVQALNGAPQNQTQFITTRFGNVLGSNGSVIPIFRRQIARKEPVTVTHPEITRFFMTIPEACQLVLEAGAMGKGGEIFIFDMGEPVRIYELAKRIIQLSGFTPGVDIPIHFTGLRPGEKLYEELLDKDENNIPTHHPKIKKAAIRPYAYDELAEKIEALTHLAQANEDALAQVRLMKAIVPEFSSQNSVFSQLDTEVKEKPLPE